MYFNFDIDAIYYTYIFIFLEINYMQETHIWNVYITTRLFRCIRINGGSSSSQLTVRVQTSKDILHNVFLVEISNAMRRHVPFLHIHVSRVVYTFPEIQIRVASCICKKLIRSQSRVTIPKFLLLLETILHFINKQVHVIDILFNSRFEEYKFYGITTGWVWKFYS